MKSSIAVARVLAMSIVMAIAGPIAAQQIYPSKPIRFITPYPAAGGNDILARLIGQKLTESWGQQVVVENRPGGNTVIGTEVVAKSPPDGYTIIMTTSSHVIMPSLLRLPFDPIKDFAAVATVAGTELLLVIHPSVPANTLQEFIALAKAKPGQLSYGTGGSGNPNHLAAVLLEILAGIKMQHVPYRGAAPIIADLMGGQVQLSFLSLINVESQIKSGRLKAIAVSGDNRMSALPRVPTFTEAGLPNMDIKQWYGVLAPAGTPRAIIDKLANEIARILAMLDVQAKLAQQGADPLITTPDQFAAQMRADLARYAKTIKTANIKLEN
jgi:tripartite-type tricarboxylate transporter receptor subunit TctC